MSSEFANVGGWLTFGDQAFHSCAQFLAVAEHRLIPSLARSICHLLGKAGFSLCLGSRVAGGHAGVGVQLTDRLHQVVFDEAQVVCIGQPMLIAGDLNADPAVIPCLAKGISAGRSVGLAFACSLGAGLAPDVTCRFNREEGAGSRRDFFIGCPNAVAASHACYVTDRWFTPHFSVLARFSIGAWMADVACPVVCQPVWPACWLDTPDRSSSSSTRVVQDVWDVYREELGVVLEEVVLALRDVC